MLISVKEASDFLGVTKEYLYTQGENGDLKTIKTDNRTLLEKEEILRKRPTVLTFFNQKGGVSKTSSAVIAADYFSGKNMKTLFVDLDPQANGTETFLDAEEVAEGKTLYDFLEHKSVKLPQVVREINDKLDILPSNIKLSGKDNVDSSELMKYKQADFYPNFKKYEVVIIDCPPSLGGLSRLGVLLANYLIMPVVYTKYCYDGLFDALETINTMKMLNSDYIDLISFGSKHTRRKRTLRDGYRDDYKNDLGEKFIDAFLPEFVGIEERPDIMDSIFNYNQINKGNGVQSKIDDIENLFNAIHEIIFEKRVL